MKVLYFCSDRHGSRRALKMLLNKGICVVGCVFEGERSNKLNEICEINRIPTFTMAEVRKKINENGFIEYDYAISYLYNRILTEDIINYNQNIINFHPAPVQVHRGIGACVYCLLNNYDTWTVTSHFLVKSIDEGDVILQEKFAVPQGITAFELEKLVQSKSLSLLEKVLDIILANKELPRRKQIEIGTYYSHKDLERDKKISLDMKKEEIDKRIKALWFPPFHGAYIEIDGEKYSLVNEKLLKEIKDLYDLDEKKYHM